MKFTAKSVQPIAEEAGMLLKALSNPHRLMIICSLVDGERSVGLLAQDLGVREALVSQHLAVLRRERIVAARRAGQTIYYRVANPAAQAVVEALSQHLCSPRALGVEPGQSVRRGKGG